MAPCHRRQWPSPDSATLKSLPRDFLEGRFWGKTGTLRGVKTLSGILETADGPRYVSMISNGDLPQLRDGQGAEGQPAPQPVRLTERTRPEPRRALVIGTVLVSVEPFTSSWVRMVWIFTSS